MKTILPFILIIFACGLCFAETTEVRLEDGNIVIEGPDGTKSLDYTKDIKYSNYRLKKWRVKEQSDPVSEALKVFKEKGAPTYSKKVWIIYLTQLSCFIMLAPIKALIWH